MSYNGIPYWIEHDENGNPQNNVWIKVNLTANQPKEFYVYYNPEGNDNSSINDGLVAYYPFNGNANDESGNGHDGTVHGATLTTDRFGRSSKAYSFDGSNDYITSNLGSHSFSQITISTWVYIDSWNDGQRILEKDISSGGYSFAFDVGVDSPGNFGFEIYVDGSAKRLFVPYSQLPTGWVHLVGVWDGNYQYLYANGVLVKKKSASGTSLSWDDSADLYIGSGKGGSGPFGYFNGKIDEVRIYNRALSDEEVKQLYEETSLKFSDGDSVFEFFDDFDGTSLDTGKWTFYGSQASYLVQNSRLKIYNYAGGYEGGFVASNLGIHENFVTQALVIKTADSQSRGRLQIANSISYNSQYNINQNAFSTLLNIVDSQLRIEWFSDDGSYDFVYTSAEIETGNLCEITVTSSNFIGKIYPYNFQHTISRFFVPQYLFLALPSVGNEDHHSIEFDWVFVRKYSSTEPSVSYGSEEVGVWVVGGYTYTKRRKVTITSSEDLQEYQVALDYSQFGDDKLYVGEPVYHYWIEHDENGNSTNKVWTKLSIPAGQEIKLKITKQDPEEDPVISNGLVAWYKLNGDATDSSSNGYNGTIYGATPTTDRFGNSNRAMYFDGVDDYIESNVQPNSSGTLCAWYLPNAFSLGYIGQWENTQTTGIRQKDSNSGDSSNGLRAYINNQALNYDVDLNLGWWYFVTLTWSNGTGKLYVNGILVDTVSYSGNPNTTTFQIGRNRQGTHYLNGKIDDVRIYNRALTDEEVWQLYTASKYHDGDKVFEFFDDFNKSSLDTEKWIGGSGISNFEVSESKLYVKSNDNSDKGIYSYPIHAIQDKNAIIESLLKVTSYATNIGITGDNENPFSAFIIDSSHDAWGGGCGSGYTFTPNGQLNTWYHIQIILRPDNQFTIKRPYGSDFDFTYDGDCNKRVRIGLQHYAEGKGYFDWVFVRKYASTEPSVTVTDKGSYFEVSIVNPNTEDLNDFQVAIPLTVETYQPLLITPLREEEEKKNKTIHFGHNF